ncbi:peptide ABC transporter substrate-binding protein, partial [Veillonellaceae bacterium M2-4]|nr:peptide ABC transporter substrate-binding protein [Veillonellaceae bacterium M2-4]
MLEYGTGYKKELQNEHLRRAMSLCVDRDVLINKVLMNGSTVPVNQLPVDYAKDPKTGKDFTEIVENHVIYDPEKAKEEWQKAKQELGKDTIEFEMLVTDD